MGKRWVPENGTEIIQRYQSGESVKALAEEIGVARATLGGFLTRSGIQTRGISDANVMQARSVPAEDRRKRAEAANRARRGSVDSAETLARRARSHQETGARIGRMERELDKELRRRGYSTTPQLAVGRFNIDIAIGSVAIEVHSNGGLPHKLERNRERVRELAEQGWHSIYVMSHRGADIQAVGEQIDAHLRDIQADPDSVSRYVLVRRTGGVYPFTYNDVL